VQRLDHAFIVQECLDGPGDFVAIDPLTPWVFVRIMPAKVGADACRFLPDLHLACRIMIVKMRADPGENCTDRSFFLGAPAPSSEREFDYLLAKFRIEHCLNSPKSLQTNGIPRLVL